MKNYHFKWISIGFLSGLLSLNSYVYSQQGYSYPTGQAVFVQPSYNSSLYTEYRYNPNQGVPNRLPAYTTNQAVFVQQPYATVPQTYTSYPTAGQYNLPYTESRFSTPANYPSTVNQAYPFATVRSYTSSPYSTTTQYPSSRYPYTSPTYTETETYPYTSVREAIPTQTQPRVVPGSSNTYGAYPANNLNPAGTYTYPSSVYPNASIYPSSNYPTTNLETPYPLSTALPETTVKPIPVPAPAPNAAQYYNNPNRVR